MDIKNALDLNDIKFINRYLPDFDIELINNDDDLLELEEQLGDVLQEKGIENDETNEIGDRAADILNKLAEI